MGGMQENFQHKLRSMRNLCCVVCSKRWYTNGECLDPALYVRVDIPFSKQKTKKQGELNSVLEDYKTFLLGYCATVQDYMILRTFNFLHLTEGKEKQKNGEHCLRFLESVISVSSDFTFVFIDTVPPSACTARYGVPWKQILRQ